MTDQLMLLEQRMSSLERQNHRLKMVLGVAVVLACAPYLLGAQQAGSDVIRASRFEVIQDGRAVATLTGGAEGGRMDVYQLNGTLGGYLRAAAKGGSLDIRDRAGILVGSFDATEDGGAAVCLSKAPSNTCSVRATATAEGGRFVVSPGTEGSRTAALLSVGADGGRLVLSDATRDVISLP